MEHDGNKMVMAIAAASIATGTMLFSVPLQARQEDAQEQLLSFSSGDLTPNMGFQAAMYESRLETTASEYVVDLMGTLTRSPGQKEVSPVMARILHLADLSDGWLGETSKRPDAELLAWLADRVEILSPQGHDVSIVPTSSGALSLEWVDASHEYSAELTADRQMFLLIDHLDDDQLDEAELPLTETRLADFLASGVIE